MSELKQWLRDWGQTFLDFIYLKNGACRLCQRSWVVGAFNNGCSDLCDDCQAALIAWPGDLVSCAYCGRFFHPSGAPQVDRCPECKSNPLPFLVGRAVGPYAGQLRQAIHGFKYGGRKDLARPFAALLLERVKTVIETGEGNPFLVVPVPLHRERLAARGFNQSDLLAKAIVQEYRAKLPTRSRVEYCPDILTRTIETPHQTGLNRLQRQLNLADAFRVAKGISRDLLGCPILLVDDIITTGSTSRECARVMIEAGSGPVSLGVLAAGVINR